VGVAFPPGGTAEHLRSWSDQMRAATSAETAIELFQIAWETDVREAAQKIRCPVLIVHPERDLTSPIEQGRLLASIIPDCRFVHRQGKRLDLRPLRCRGGSGRYVYTGGSPGPIVVWLTCTLRSRNSAPYPEEFLPCFD
jgi:hypothetical protein